MIKYKIWIAAIVLISLLFLSLNMDAAQIKSITNYVLKKDVVDEGGAPSQSTNYKLVDAIGQPAGIGTASSSNYRESSGFFSGGEISQNPVLSVSPTTLNFGTDKNSLQLQISNAGAGTLNWSISENPDKPWITSINPSSGTDNGTVTVTVDRNQLSGNSDTGTLGVSSNGGTQNVTVKIGKSDNILVNGDFSGGTDPWWLYVHGSANATGSVQNGEYLVSINNGGTEVWHIELGQNYLLIENGKKYIVSFEAYAIGQRNIALALKKGLTGEWISYHYQGFKLTTTKRKYKCEFKMEHPTDHNAVFYFDLGNSTEDVYIDNVIIREKAITGKLVNGDFSNGDEYWVAWTSVYASAYDSVQNGEFIISIDNGGSEMYHVQLMQTDLLIENGKDYTLSFDAYSEGSREIWPSVGHTYEPWTRYHSLQTFNLTTTWQTYSFSFTMSQPTDSEARILFDVGISNLDVHFDNITITTSSSSPVLTVNPTTLDFGTSHNNLTFQISNSGGGILDWTVQENPDKPWITSINPNQGSNNATVTVTVDRSKLSGDSDTGTLLVSSNGGNQNVTVKIGEEGGVPIAPRGPVSQPPGTEFWVDIDVGSSSNPVSNLFGVSFELNYTNTTYIDYVTSEAGTFIGNDVIFFPTPDDANGKVSLGISRKSGQGGVSGHGSVARIKLAVAPGTPNDTQIQFTIKNVSANDPDGNPLQLSPKSLTVTIGVNTIIVWPGDTNNDGIVNQADILPIGLYWGKTGTERSNASINWIGQPATPWTPEKATYADANGDGIVNQADVLAIGLNWNKTHTGFLVGNMSLNTPQVCQSDTGTIMLKFNGNTNPGQSFFLDVIAKNVIDLFGLSYELFYSPNSFIDSLSVEIGSGNILGTETDLIFFPVVEEKAGLDTGKVSVGLSRKFGQGGVTADSGLVTRIKVHMSEEAVIDESMTLFWFKNIAANDAAGNTIPFKVDTRTLNLVTDVATRVDRTVPTTHLLCQNRPNPFNPETTIEYHLPYSVEVQITIYNLQGQEIRKLAQGIKQAGIYTVRWDGKNNAGHSVPSGMYFYQLKANSQIPGKRSLIDTKRMILMK